MYGYLVTQLDEFMANSLTIPQDAINFIRLCAVQIETLKASIEETPVSQATHKKAVVLFLREVRSFLWVAGRCGLTVLCLSLVTCSASR